MTGKLESPVQAEVRLRAARLGWQLWRNNVGALLDARGVPVRYGLANDTKALNARLKSGDLIGWRTLTITPDMVGQTLAQFVSLECKRADGGRVDPAQAAWQALVERAGGLALIVSDASQLPADER